MTMELREKPAVGSHWKHALRGSVAVVLRVEEDAITFQFPRARNNPARGTTSWPLAKFFNAFVPV